MGTIKQGLKDSAGRYKKASVAQLVERLTVNQQAGGSSPPRGAFHPLYSNIKKGLLGIISMEKKEVVIEEEKAIELKVEDSEVEINVEPYSKGKIAVWGKGKVKILVNMAEGAQLNACYIWEGGEGEVETKLIGRGSEAHDTHLFVEDKKLKVKMLLRHVGEDTKGSIEARGLVKKEGEVALDGMIKIEKSGAGAQSILEEHVMLLEEGAKATANPELEIENNNVCSTHSASVAQLDKEAVFYLMCRGLREREAKRMIMEGFLDKGVERVEERLREKVAAYLKAKI